MLSNLPTSWAGVFLDQYQALMKLDKELSFYQKQMEILAILTDTEVSDEYWEDLDVEELSNMIASLHWLKSEPIFTKHSKYSKIDFDKISFGEFIDLEYYFTNYFDNLSIIASICYRQHKINEWGSIVLEPYGEYDIQLRADEFDELSINYFYWVIPNYLAFKDKIMEVYVNLFNPIFDDEEINEEEMDAEEIADMEAEKKNQEWAWESILWKLSNNDITKYDEIIKLPLIFVLNQLSFQQTIKL